jgi:hypothetical protein
MLEHVHIAKRMFTSGAVVNYKTVSSKVERYVSYEVCLL